MYKYRHTWRTDLTSFSCPSLLPIPDRNDPDTVRTKVGDDPVPSYEVSIFVRDPAKVKTLGYEVAITETRVSFASDVGVKNVAYIAIVLPERARKRVGSSWMTLGLSTKNLSAQGIRRARP